MPVCVSRRCPRGAAVAWSGAGAERHRARRTGALAAERRRDAQPARVWAASGRDHLLRGRGPDVWGTERERADVGGERRRAGAGALLGERDPTGPDAGDGGAQSDGRGRRALRRGPTAARRQGTEERRPTGGLRGEQSFDLPIVI